ncbi:hypothetical protein [Mesorhizobium amorphae]|uniref:hypothetical protein n=1 Tax=Mesorhizobium amorphae TaxID=71433 RepID=UPI0016430477|nr:hypothetical protein [Mesorhizobium amorphae]
MTRGQSLAANRHVAGFSLRARFGVASPPYHGQDTGAVRAIPAEVRSGFASGIAYKQRDGALKAIFAGNALEQFQQKCAAVLRPELRTNKEMEH